MICILNQLTGFCMRVQDKVLDIMGPLSKLWVMVEQVDSGNGSSSTVEMYTVLELLEKKVLLIGQCNNTITYERRKNILLGITGTTSSSQVALLLREKAEFLRKHDQAFFGKDFRDNLTESLKAKNLSKQLQKLVNLPTERSPYQGRPNGGAKIQVEHFVKCIIRFVLKERDPLTATAKFHFQL